MSISEADVAAMRGHALLSSDGEPGLDHVTLAGRSVLLASVLTGHGLGRGDVVALLSEQSAGVYELLAGVRRAGLVLMVVDPAHSLEQMAFAINTTGALVIVASTGQSAAAEALVSLTPYVRARYGLDGELPEHRSLPLARSAAPVRLINADPAGTIHHTIGPSGRPVALRLPDPLAGSVGRSHLRELVGDVVIDASTVLVGSTPALSAVAAQLGTAVLASGGGVGVPRRPTGVEVLRTAFAVEATVLHLTREAAAEIAELGVDRVLRLTPPDLGLVVVDGAKAPESVRRALEDLWGAAVRVVEPGYLDPDRTQETEASACSVTQAEI